MHTSGESNLPEYFTTDAPDTASSAKLCKKNHLTAAKSCVIIWSARRARTEVKACAKFYCRMYSAQLDEAIPLMKGGDADGL